jgi:hypothetical protein
MISIKRCWEPAARYCCAAGPCPAPLARSATGPGRVVHWPIAAITPGAGITIGDPQYVNVPTPGKSRSSFPASDGPVRTKTRAIMKLRARIRSLQLPFAGETPAGGFRFEATPQLFNLSLVKKALTNESWP